MNITAIENSIRVLESCGELGTTDCRRLFDLLPHLDAKGSIEASVACKLLFDEPLADANLRAFLQRVKHAIDTACQAESQRDTASDPDQKTRLAALQAFSLKSERKRSDRPKRLAFSALDLPVAISPIANRIYKKQEFVAPSAAPRLRLFVSYARENQRLAVDLCNQLKQVANKLPLPPIELWIDTKDIPPGALFDPETKKAMRNADYGLALLSQAFFDSDYILDHELAYFLGVQNQKRPNLIPLTLESIDQSCGKLRKYVEKKTKRDKRAAELQQMLDMQWFELQRFNTAVAFDQCTTAAERKEFVSELLRSKFGDLLKRNTPTTSPTVQGLEDISRLAYYQEKEFTKVKGVPSRIEPALPQRLNSEAKPPATKAEAVDVISDMLNWATAAPGGKSLPLYALLGEFGMGKTFACREFSRRLNEQSKERGAFYIDLRDTPTLIDTKQGLRVPTLKEIIAGILELAKHPCEDKDVDTVIEQIRRGQLVLVVDGLDERLTHFHRAQQQDYMNALLGVFAPGESGEATKVRMLLSCRSHYFETNAIQSSFLLNAHRGKAESSDYRAVELLPFNDEQMQDLLKKRIGDDATETVWAMLEANPPLKDLASRPWLLAQLSISHDALNHQHQRGQPLNLATVFDAIIEDTLSRDDEKHLLHRRHKRRLLQALAAHLGQTGSQQIDIDELNDWYQRWLDAGGLRSQYPGTGDQALILEKDLRNSSLLVRSGERSFGFGHSSMQEFFLAKWLAAELLDSDTERLRQLNLLPSRETFDFLRELLQTTAPQSLHQGLARVLAGDASSVAARELALRVLATQPTVAALEFSHIDLSGMTLYRAAINGIRCQRLTLRHTSLKESRWRDCRIEELTIEDSSLFGSSWVDCTLGAVLLRGNNNLRQLTLADGRWAKLAEHCARLYPVSYDSKAAKREDTALLPLEGGHKRAVNSVAFDPNGQRLVSGGQDGTLKFWDTASGACLRTIDAHQGGVLNVAFDPSGQRLVSGGSDGTVKLWDAASGACLRTLDAYQGGVLNVAFDRSGQRLVSAGKDGMVKLWDAANGACLRTLDVHQDGVRSVAFDRSGERLVSASEDGTVKLWDAASGDCLRTLDAHQDGVLNVAFDPSGQRLGSAGDDGTVKLWDAASGACLRTLDAHQGLALSVAFDPSGQRLVSSGVDGTVKLWDAASGACLCTIDAHQGWVQNVAFDRSGERLVSGGRDGTVKLWDAASGACLRTIDTHQDWVLSVTFDRSGERLVSGGRDGAVKLWDAASGACLHTIAAHQGWVLSIAFDRSGERMVSGGSDGTVKLRDAASGACLRTIDAHQGRVLSVAFDRSGERLGSAGRDGTIKLWEAASGACLYTIKAHQGWVLNVAFDRSGERLVSASDDGTVKLWDVASGACLRAFDAHQGWVRSIAFDRSGERLVSGGSDGTVKLREAASFACLRTIKAHQGEVRSIAFDHSGQRLGSGGDDGTVKLWDAASGACLHTIDAHQDWVRNVAFDRSGQRLVSASNDGTVKLWQLSADGTAATLQKTLMAFADNQWLCVDYEQNSVTSTELAWRYVNFSDGKKTAAIDAFKHRYVRSAPLKQR